MEAIQSESKALKQEIDSIYQHLTSELDDLKEKEKTLSRSIALSEENTSNIANTLEIAKNHKTEIENIASDCQGKSGVISNFNEKITERESQLENQKVTTDKYTEKLERFTEVHEKYLKEAEALISSAKKALGYKTAEGLSAAFTEQYNSANKY